jgi:hypothetical protein
VVKENRTCVASGETSLALNTITHKMKGFYAIRGPQKGDDVDTLRGLRVACGI